MIITRNDINECRLINNQFETKEYFIEKYGEKMGEIKWKRSYSRILRPYNLEEKKCLKLLEDNITDKKIIFNNFEYVDINIKNYESKDQSNFFIKGISSIIEDYCSNDLSAITYFSLLRKERVVKINFSLKLKNYEDEYDRTGKRNIHNISLLIPIKLLCRLLLYNPFKIDNFLEETIDTNLNYLSIGLELYNNFLYKSSDVR
jgi:hypothetical protein